MLRKAVVGEMDDAVSANTSQGSSTSQTPTHLSSSSTTSPPTSLHSHDSQLSLPAVPPLAPHEEEEEEGQGEGQEQEQGQGEESEQTASGDFFIGTDQQDAEITT